jgi:hypothetical protein
MPAIATPQVHFKTRLTRFDARLKSTKQSPGNLVQDYVY